MLTLDVAISTYREEGILRVGKMIAHLPSQEGVRFVVSWQEYGSGEIPEALRCRKDVTILRLDKPGLSCNRNNALNHCRADIVLIADDDLIYYPGAFQEIRDTFEQHPELDVALFKIDFKNKKFYPGTSMELHLPLPKNFYVNSIEMSFRRLSVEKLRFREDMGLGAPRFHCGEEEVFLYSAIKKGLKTMFIDKVIASHPYDSTGDFVSPGILRGQGFVIGVYYPFTGLLRIVLKAIRLKRSGKCGFLKSLRHLTSGLVSSKTGGYRKH